MHNTKKHCFMMLLVVTTSWLPGPQVYADVVTDWSNTAGEIAVAGKLPPGGAYRAVAVVRTMVCDAVNAITKRYPRRVGRCPRGLGRRSRPRWRRRIARRWPR